MPPIPSHQQADTSANATHGPRLWDRATTLEFFGGIDVSTLYRGVHSGRYPRPVNVSNNVVRWLADECEAALERMIGERDGRKRVTQRGRPRRLVAADENRRLKQNDHPCRVAARFSITAKIRKNRQPGSSDALRK